MRKLFRQCPDYPVGVPRPKNRYSTDYGTAWPDLLGPAWAWVIAYDLNTGNIKWKQPLGEDAAASKAGNKNTGAVNRIAEKRNSRYFYRSIVLQWQGREIVCL
jgi:hypothetical protein